mmetsp:Transcript_31518/g.78769  ORF Transcript_31518/g.78769 Transcript_31518/m.78769 type:complete len:443 (-) Transcript_31518:910-2238(-)
MIAPRRNRRAVPLWAEATPPRAVQRASADCAKPLEGRGGDTMADEDTGLVGTRTQSHRARQCAADEAMLRWCFSDRFFTVNLFTTRRRILNSTATIDVISIKSKGPNCRNYVNIRTIRSHLPRAPARAHMSQLTYNARPSHARFFLPNLRRSLRLRARGDLVMPRLQPVECAFALLQLLLAPFEIEQQLLRVDHRPCRLHAGVVRAQPVARLLDRGERVPSADELHFPLRQLPLEPVVLRRDELKLLLEVGQHVRGGGHLLAQLEQLLVPLLDLLVERLVLDLELLEVDKVEPVCEPLLLPQRLLELVLLVAPGDVTQPHLRQLLVARTLALVEALDELGHDRPACARVLSGTHDLPLEVGERCGDLSRLILPARQLGVEVRRLPVQLALELRERRAECLQLRQRLDVALLLLVHRRALGLLLRLLLALARALQVIGKLALQ